jgi:hypothetical protein
MESEGNVLATPEDSCAASLGASNKRQSKQAAQFFIDG